VAWVRSRSREGCKLKIEAANWSKALAVAAFTLLARHMGVNLPVNVWGPSISYETGVRLSAEVARIKAPSAPRGVGCGEGLCSLSSKLLISLILNGTLWWILGVKL
jgi:hypothetical protein